MMGVVVVGGPGRPAMTPITCPAALPRRAQSAQACAAPTLGAAEPDRSDYGTGMRTWRRGFALLGPLGLCFAFHLATRTLVVSRYVCSVDSEAG
jgi:hypothetical protein